MITCPKCLHEQEDPGACHRCGLDLARVASGDLDYEGAGGEDTVSEALMARWADLTERLDDEEGHHAFIQACVEADRLELAGRLYHRLDPMKADPRVEAYRARILKAAMVQMGQVLGANPSTRRMRTLIFLTFGALMLLLFAVGHHLLSRAMERTLVP